MSTSCAPLVVDLFLYFYEKDFVLSLSKHKQDVMDTFNIASRYHDDTCLIDKIRKR